MQPTDLSGSDEEIFRRIDSIAERIRRYACEPKFSQDLRIRCETEPDYDLADAHVLKTMVELIAYSEAVRSVLIDDLVERGVLDRVFPSYAPDKIAELDPDELKDMYWNNPARPNERLSPLRFPKKLTSIVESARGLQEQARRHGSFMRFLAAQGFPRRIGSPADIESFWRAFDLARKEINVNFYANFTSLCHLLQILGFDCAKPDSVVMNVAARLGIVAEVKRKQYSERHKCRVVLTMQLYSASRGIRTPVVDLYFLVHGRQTGAAGCVLGTYYGSNA